MTHTYDISGMTCDSCRVKVQGVLAKVPGVTNVEIDLSKGQAVLNMVKHVPTEDLKAALKVLPAYQLSEIDHHASKVSAIETEEVKPWLQTYRPILLIFAFIIGVSLLTEWLQEEFLVMRWMNHFMAGFFLVFSFFKLLDLNGFADNYSTYDVVAKKWRNWGYIYAFIELALGIAYLAAYRPILVNSITFVVMSLSIIGVLQAIFNKRKIKCACLGAVFNLPMSTVTVVEDVLMIAMSGFMLMMML